MTRPTFTIKLQSLRGDGIRDLRHILKRLLRTYGFKCIAAREEIQEFPPPRD
jgi:hypothetical protein